MGGRADRLTPRAEVAFKVLEADRGIQSIRSLSYGLCFKDDELEGMADQMTSGDDLKADIREACPSHESWDDLREALLDAISTYDRENAR